MNPYKSVIENVTRIYEWNDRVDTLRANKAIQPFDLTSWLKILNEERDELHKAQVEHNEIEEADALADIFVVCVWELRKLWLSLIEVQDLFNDQWEIDLNGFRFAVIKTLWVNNMFVVSLCDAIRDLDRYFPKQKDHILTEVIDKLFTRFGDGCYVNESNKFIKSSDYIKPDLWFVQHKL